MSVLSVNYTISCCKYTCNNALLDLRLKLLLVYICSIFLSQECTKLISTPHIALNCWIIEILRLTGYAIVGQVHEFIVKFGWIVVVTCKSQVAFIKVPNAERSPWCDNHPLPNIEFLVHNDHRVFNILLNDPYRIHFLLRLNCLDNILKFTVNSDAPTARLPARFEYPCVFCPNYRILISKDGFKPFKHILYNFFAGIFIDCIFILIKKSSKPRFFREISLKFKIYKRWMNIIWYRLECLWIRIEIFINKDLIWINCDSSLTNWESYHKSIKIFCNKLFIPTFWGKLHKCENLTKPEIFLKIFDLITF